MLCIGRLSLRALLAAGTLAISAPGTAAGTDGDRDVMFGHENVELGIDREVIKVGEDLGKFNRIRLRVLGTTFMSTRSGSSSPMVRKAISPSTPTSRPTATRAGSISTAASSSTRSN